MKTIELDMYQATAVAALVLLLGRILVAKISILRRYCIPAPVVGGFLYAIVHTIVRGMGILEISCDMTLKNVFMVAFFCSVGFTASFRMLKKGDVGFTAVMLRGFIELYQVDGNKVYLDSFARSLDYAWTHAREDNGLFNTDFTGKSCDNRKWLLTQAAMVEMYARLAVFANQSL